jgi:NAD(P)-dependent dehydrogenase (short-subunit alcohol dehydrogenase family)
MKTIVLTGATSGIGKEVALQLLRHGHRVISNARDLNKADLVASELKETSGNDKLLFLKADLADFSSVKAFADAIGTECSSVDILINNAGTWEMEFSMTKDGIETNLQVNHLSPMLLTLELLPLLEQAGSGRIVNTSSMAHRRNIYDFNDMEWTRKPYDGVATYSQSKLFNLLFSLHLKKLMVSQKTTVNTVHPGYVQTQLFNKMGARNWEGIPAAAYGARSTLFAALSPELEGISGKFFYLEQEEPAISSLAKDEALANELWEISMRYISGYLTKGIVDSLL